jgi:hypothetical protein
VRESEEEFRTLLPNLHTADAAASFLSSLLLFPSASGMLESNFFMGLQHRDSNDNKRMAKEKLSPISLPDQVLQKQSQKPDRSSQFGNSSGFWTSDRRQYVVIAAVNLVTFLQGASLPTTAISLPRMPGANETNEIANGTSWPADFVVTESDRQNISKISNTIMCRWVAKLR